MYFWQDYCNSDFKQRTMKKYVIFACAVAVGQLLSAQTLKDAIYKTDNERFSDAVIDFSNLAKQESTNGTNYFYFGELYFERGLMSKNDKVYLDSALILWNKAYSVDPTNPMSLVAKGKALWVQGQTDSGKQEFLKAVTSTKNKNAEVLRAIAETYIDADKQNLDEAIVLLETAVKLDPKNEDGHLLLGDALLEKTPQNGSPAIKSYNKVLEINPKSPRGIVRVAKLYQRAQNFEEANKYYQQAKDIDATYAPAYRENAELNMLFKQSAKAIENWKKYLELNNSQEARYRFVTALFNGKQYCEAIPEIENLQSQGFNNFYMERMISYSAVDCAQSDAALVQKGLQASDRFFTLVPQEKIIFMDYKYRGLLYSKNNQDSLAIVELEKASSLDAEAAKELSGDIGRLYMKLKKYQKVIEAYTLKKSALGLTATEYFELGRAYFFGPKDYVSADSAFAKLVELSPTYAPGFLWRARSSYPLDPTKEKWLAKPYLEEVYKLVKPEERAIGPNKAMVMEACKYLGDYYINSSEKDIAKAKEYWNVVKELDPADKQAAAFFKANGN